MLGQQGMSLFFVGALLTLVTSFFTIVVGYRFLGMEMTHLLGVTCGIHTQPAGLAFAEELSGTRVPSLYYAAVQPLSIVAKILLAQLLVLFG